MKLVISGAEIQKLIVYLSSFSSNESFELSASSEEGLGVDRFSIEISHLGSFKNLDISGLNVGTFDIAPPVSILNDNPVVAELPLTRRVQVSLSNIQAEAVTSGYYTPRVLPDNTVFLANFERSSLGSALEPILDFAAGNKDKFQIINASGKIPIYPTSRIWEVVSSVQITGQATVKHWEFPLLRLTTGEFTDGILLEKTFAPNQMSYPDPLGTEVDTLPAIFVGNENLVDQIGGRQLSFTPTWVLDDSGTVPAFQTTPLMYYCNNNNWNIVLPNAGYVPYSEKIVGKGLVDWKTVNNFVPTSDFLLQMSYIFRYAWETMPRVPADSDEELFYQYRLLSAPGKMLLELQPIPQEWSDSSNAYIVSCYDAENIYYSADRIITTASPTPSLVPLVNMGKLKSGDWNSVVDRIFELVEAFSDVFTEDNTIWIIGGLNGCLGFIPHFAPNTQSLTTSPETWAGNLDETFLILVLPTAMLESVNQPAWRCRAINDTHSVCKFPIYSLIQTHFFLVLPKQMDARMLTGIHPNRKLPYISSACYNRFSDLEGLLFSEEHTWKFAYPIFLA